MTEKQKPETEKQRLYARSILIAGVQQQAWIDSQLRADSIEDSHMRAYYLETVAGPKEQEYKAQVWMIEKLFEVDHKTVVQSIDEARKEYVAQEAE